MKDKLFDLFGSIWEIKYVDHILQDEDDEEHFYYGLTTHGAHKIEIAIKDPDGKPLPKEEIKISLLHELMHAILGQGMFSAYNGDEPCVEWCARSINSLINQKII